MKKFLNVILVGIYFFLLTGCEEVILESEFVFEEKLVVRGILDAGFSLENIYVGKTLPVFAEYGDSYTHLTDAVVILRSGSTVVNLRHFRDGIYRAPEVTIQEGATYELIVYWNSLTANAIIAVPNAGSPGIAQIVNYSRPNNTLGKKIRASVTPNGLEAYGATWAVLNVNDRVIIEAEEFDGVFRVQKGEQVLNLNIPTVEIPSSVYSSSASSLGVVLYVYNTEYYDYFSTAGSGKLADALFGQPSTSVIWNVKGDGIGMVAGRTRRIIRAQEE